MHAQHAILLITIRCHNSSMVATGEIAHTHVAGIQNRKSAPVMTGARTTINVKEEFALKKYAQHLNPIKPG